MTPCGCLKEMTERVGWVKMRFVGKRDGKMVKGAPGNYTNGQIYLQPFSNSNLPYWELIDKPADLTVPEPSEEDNVFEDVPFIEEELGEITMSGTPTFVESEYNFDPNTPATVELQSSFNLNPENIKPPDIKVTDHAPTQKQREDLSVDELLALLKEKGVELPEEPETEEPVQEEPAKSRDELLAILEEADVEVKPRTRTTTLRKMVDELVSKEVS